MLFAELVPLTAALDEARAAHHDRDGRHALLAGRVRPDVDQPEAGQLDAAGRARSAMVAPPRAKPPRARGDPAAGRRVRLPTEVRRRSAGGLRRGRALSGRVPRDRPRPGDADAARHRRGRAGRESPVARALLQPSTPWPSARAARSNGSAAPGERRVTLRAASPASGAATAARTAANEATRPTARIRASVPASQSQGIAAAPASRCGSTATNAASTPHASPPASSRPFSAITSAASVRRRNPVARSSANSRRRSMTLRSCTAASPKVPNRSPRPPRLWNVDR